MTIAEILNKAADVIGATIIGADGVTPRRKTDRADKMRPAHANDAGGAR